MSILIKGMELPKGSHEIIVRIQSDGRVLDQWGHKLNQEFMAIPVPKHGRLGDLDRMLADNEIYYNQLGRPEGEIGARYRSVKRSIELAPTIIPADKEE